MAGTLGQPEDRIREQARRLDFDGCVESIEVRTQGDRNLAPQHGGGVEP
jgi:hypothetical protein